MQAYLLRQMFGLCANSRSGFLLVIKRKGKIVCFDFEILMHCAVRAWVSKKKGRVIQIWRTFCARTPRFNGPNIDKVILNLTCLSKKKACLI